MQAIPCLHQMVYLSGQPLQLMFSYLPYRDTATILIYINGIAFENKILHSSFADDTNLYVVVGNTLKVAPIRPTRKNLY